MKVRWTDPAQTDLFEILDSIARDNPPAAQRVEQRLVDAGASLAQQARRGGPGRIQGTRELAVSRLPYIVIYRIVERPLHAAARRDAHPSRRAAVARQQRIDRVAQWAASQLAP
ncbi:MAG TPA: type II toxin-antitoxin system RelE/ParE family toxin [Geminicoccaceae bacterium]|nr:type II toxin-antitoxin system RelE/ParE family toxin [Geminicoccaceae bacterium]